jgi:hypothetical protein
MSAIPIGAPGCPDFAFWTASILKARIAFANSLREDMLDLDLYKTEYYTFFLPFFLLEKAPLVQKMIIIFTCNRV